MSALPYPSQSLAGLMADLDALDDECDYVLGPPGQGWLALAELRGDTLDALIGRVLEGLARGHRDAAAVGLAGWLASSTVGSAGVALAIWGRTWALDPARTWLRLHADGWPDGLAVDSPLRIASDDPSSTERLGRLWAEETVELLTPVFAQISAYLRFGVRAMWGSVADGVVGHGMWLASRNALDADRIWADSARLVDQLAAVAPVPPARQRRVPVTWSGGVHDLSVRSTCCLAYRSAVDADPAGEGYCTSCPLRTEESRVIRLTDWLDAQPAHAGSAPSARPPPGQTPGSTE